MQVLLMPLQMVEISNPHPACCIRRVEEQMLREDDKCASPLSTTRTAHAK